MIGVMLNCPSIAATRYEHHKSEPGMSWLTGAKLQLTPLAGDLQVTIWKAA